MTYKAAKVVIITEKVILEQVAEVIEAHGATGYTVFAAGGKGSRGVRPTGRAAVVDGFSNVQIEVITATHITAEEIAVDVAERFFQNYSGITYLEDVEILRSHKF
ncbi:MAG: hypothetical protein NXH81_05380 [Halieaceae bacterium]|jgi:nitrogen regulatory protein PII|nr:MULTISPECIES: hypothetical protein [Haliea]MCR9184809.1 hypothetical protein [Halieaceae bacterium]MAD62738.1 hypothetical protein [Haliea sp.]MAD62978.1 hypothetical protein [Haliea sp.]MAY91634.1 hypothetical protein [Haliea sp.]MBK40617.1 hypothetical protein [Haliea sp.]|tara:strand:- start:15808 stop:16122 length:315 start_codon:yes stop_codon:yes gene_type:complete